jgi:hypothetical protein
MRGGIMMAILEKDVIVRLGSANVKHYEEKGYEIPTYIDKQGRLKVKSGTQILVRVEDLSNGSNVKVTKLCDIEGCNKKISQSYSNILISRKKQVDGMDKCKECSDREKGAKKGKASLETCIATTHPDFAKLFWNEEDAYKYSYGSNKRTDFKCPKCLRKVKNKIIFDVFKQGISCICGDGVSIPEKIMYHVLKQIGVDFEFQKKFNWSNRRMYDFYISSLNLIIETHGRQHYDESGFEITLSEQREIDKTKEEMAKNNGVNHYIALDCRKSEIDWIKENILKSELIDLYDLSHINWVEAEKFSFSSSFVKQTCELWEQGTSVPEISDRLKLGRQTIRKYLKQGVKLSWCVYNPKEEMIKNGRKNGGRNKKEVVQIKPDGKVVFWKSAAEASEELNVSFKYISAVCTGREIKAYGSKWMFKTDYDQL